ncbi:MAG: CoA transferase [Dehalococcoidia bacterium]|nr:CoA transferase [Dehalococcoidia bacterium]
MTTNPPLALSQFRVLDLTQSHGQYASRLLADLGADVIKVEPPEGGPDRWAWPFAGDVPDRERSLSFLHFNTNKRSVVLDLTTANGRKAFLKLAAAADAVVEDLPPGYLAKLRLGYHDLRKVNPGIVMTSITPFGQSGPRSYYEGTDLVIQAMSGWMTTDGDNEFPPCAAPGDPTVHLAGMHGAMGTLLALWARGEHGRGQHVDTSLYEVMVTSLSSMPISRYSLSGEIVRRPGRRVNTAAVNYYPCKDGYVAMNIHFDHLWERLVKWVNHPVLNEPYWLARGARQQNADLVEEILQEFSSNMTAEEFLKGALALGLPVARVNTFSEALEVPQLKARHWLQEVHHPVLGRISVPGLPWLLRGTPPRVRRSAPLLGEHTEEILREAAATAVQRGASTNRPKQVPPRTPLEGIRVVDLTRAFAGPFASRLLADYGAEVIKVESDLFDTQREGRAGTFTELNRNKLSITLDLHHPDGQALLKKLVAVSDVLIDNYRPGTLERFGLAYDDLKEINPRIIVVSMPAYGSTGPAAGHAAHGTQLIANAGITHLWGHPESPMQARSKSTYPDLVAGAQAALATLAGLHGRKGTGAGQSIEVAQSEVLLSTLGVGLLDYLVNGRVWQPTGNRRAFAAPHDLYPCRGLDAHCAIACVTEEQWRSLCQVMARPDLAEDARFATLQDRVTNVEELDQIIATWTRDLTPSQVAYLLQRARVPAGAVQTGEDIYYDWHLRERGYVARVDDPETGDTEISGLTAHLSETPGRQQMQGRPTLGGANDYVFHQILGLSQEERQRLEAEKAIA